MGFDVQRRVTADKPAADAASQTPAIDAGKGDGPKLRRLEWVFFGEDGLRVGWRIAVFALLLKMTFQIVEFLLGSLRPAGAAGEVSASDAFLSELAGFVTVAVAVAVMARIEGRRILDYNLRGQHRLAHFGGGLVAGFLTLSALVGVLEWGHWLQFGAVGLTGTAIVEYGVVWGCVFLLVGFVEEGTMRCYAQYTLARGISFWWALAGIAGICAYMAVRTRGNCVWGVYAFALLGLIPCFVLHLKKVEGAGFWQAAWATSTFFAFGHTSNGGENWVGIFAVALIGFVFCTSVKVTGSAWWAIGCHTAWDWGETFFYGTPDSGFTAQGHFLTSTSAGSVFWSGGADGPEGSVLVLPVILLLLAAILLIYGRGRTASVAVNARAAATEAG